MVEGEVPTSWYSVRCVVKHGANGYEERVTLWHSDGFASAIAKAEDEAQSYAEDVGNAEYVGLAQAFQIAGEPEEGAEVFSLIRESNLSAKDYLSRFFDTGDELQGQT